MALIECSECGKSISDMADTCPGCGVPVELSQSNDNIEPASLKYSVVVVIGAFILLYLIKLGLDGVYYGFIHGTENEMEKGWLLLILILSYFSIGIALNIKLLRRLIEWHPANATISNVVSTKIRAIIVWPFYYPYLIFQLFIIHKV